MCVRAPLAAALAQLDAAGAAATLTNNLRSNLASKLLAQNCTRRSLKLQDFYAFQLPAGTNSSLYMLKALYTGSLRPHTLVA